MNHKYDESEARDFVRRYPYIDKAFALRIYTSRLIGSDPQWVLHGGGNTSVKLEQNNLLGEKQAVLMMKGSGQDLSEIEPQGFVPLEQDSLEKLKSLSSLSDKEMENQLLINKLNAESPDPSVEALLHAFLPYRFVDHTHADAILMLTNQKEGIKLSKKVLGPKVGILPYLTSGFPLAKAVSEMALNTPDLEAIVVAYHGVFTFGDTAEIGYQRMVGYISKAESYFQDQEKIKDARSGVAKQKPEKYDLSGVARLAQVLRGACAYKDSVDKYERFFTEIRRSPDIVAISGSADAESFCQSGVLTPDHVIRTKNQYIFLDDIPDSDEQLQSAVKASIEKFKQAYDDYYHRNISGREALLEKLDSSPRVFLVKGLGLIALGKTRKEAVITADIAEHTLTAKERTKPAGEYVPLDENHVFEMEYWELQQKKIRARSDLLKGQVAVVTGAGGAIGFGIADRLLAEGAVVAVTDIDESRLEKVRDILAEKYGLERVEMIVFDVTDYPRVESSMAEISARMGGVDLVIPNAGLAHVSKIEEMDPDKFDQVVSVNLKGTLNLIKAAAPIFRRQGTGGNIVLVSSKNVFDPGAAFGAYSASKAGAHQISKIAAMELAELGVRVNMVNPDAVFGDEKISSKLWDLIGPDRMKARGLDPEGLRDYYRQRNLLKSSVLAEHVGNAVVFFASEQTPTTGATLPVDGGIPSAFPR